MPIGAVTNLPPVQSSSTLTQQDFLNVLLTQLTVQDPLKPQDNDQFMAQLAQFSTLEQTQQLNTNIQTLISNQAALQSVGLLGATVDINTDSGLVSGTVSALSLTGDSPLLTIKTVGTPQNPSTTLTNIGLGQLVSVRRP